jgi:hypothetical protein
VVTVLGFLLGRDSGFQQRLLGSAVADFPIIGDQVQDNIHGLRGSGVGLVIGFSAFAWGARGLTQVAQHAMAEIWNIPGRQRPRFWAQQVRGLLLLVVFAVGLGAVSVLTWLGSYGGKAAAVALANLVAAAAVNVGLFLLAFRVLTPNRSRPGSCLLVRWSPGSPGRPCRPPVATWSTTTCVTPARCMGCSRSSLACCSGCNWARGSPCTPPKSTSWPPDSSGRGPATTTPGPRRPPSLDLEDPCWVRLCR